MLNKSFFLLSIPLWALPALGQSPMPPTQTATSTSATLPEPQIFAPGVISGPANDGAPSFSPDGNTLFFTRSTAHWTVILESRKIDGQWSKPTLASFSGEWPDSSPAVSPDGTYIVFQSTRPAAPVAAPPRAGESIPGIVSNLWRVDRSGSGWSEPKRLPDTVNIGHSIWKPSIAADGTIYLTVIDDKGGKRLFSSKYVDGTYQTAQPLSFSDGKTADVDPEIAPDESFLIFCSSGRAPADGKDHLYIIRKSGGEWGPVVQIRYAGDEKPYGFSTDDEPRLGPDHRTLYFSSDRAIRVNFPRTHEHALQDVERLDSWDNSNSNVWSIPIAPYL